MKKEYDFSKGKRGAVVPLPPGKLRITIRLDKDILEWFKRTVDEAGGGHHQTMMDDPPGHFMIAERQPLEDSLRRVVREELATYGKQASPKRRAKSMSPPAPRSGRAR